MTVIDNEIEGAKAQSLADDPILNQALDDVREGIITKLEDAAITDKALQGELQAMLFARKLFVAQLKRYIRDGEFAKAEREQQERDRERDRPRSVNR
jgi:hypothetical protein